MTLVDGCCQAEGLQACFYFEGRVIKNGVAFKHSPLFFAQAAGTDASPAARAIWSKLCWHLFLHPKGPVCPPQILQINGDFLFFSMEAYASS